MGSENLSFSSTRLEVIIEELKKAERYKNDYLMGVFYGRLATF